MVLIVAAELFSISFEERECDALVSFGGEMDMATVGPATKALSDAVTSHGRVIVDLRKVTFMDSSGLTVLLAARNLSSDPGRLVVVTAPAGQVHRLLTTTGVERLLTVTHSVPRAREAGPEQAQPLNG